MVNLTAHEALSGVFGSISLISWIVVLVPQLVQNYRTQSAEAISITFLCIWFLGDCANLAGAIWAGLVPTVIALAVYFCIADSILITQCLYYNYRNRKQQDRDNVTAGSAVADGDHEEDEEEPLLSRRGSAASGKNVGLPGSIRRKSSAASRRRAGDEPALTKIYEEDEYNETGLRASMKNLGSVLLVCGIGAAAWAICWKVGIWQPAASPEGQKGSEAPLGAEILGYASAVLYLGARIPQVVKNYREKSCEGLSLLFFLLSLLGNLTYGAGILCHSLDRGYIITNLPWLIGSLGTIFEDCTLFAQFYLYRK